MGENKAFYLNLLKKNFHVIHVPFNSLSQIIPIINQDYTHKFETSQIINFQLIVMLDLFGRK